MTPDIPAYDLEAWRRRIPALGSLIPMANCSHAPLTDAAREAALAYLESWERGVMDWDTWVDEVDRARAAFARLIHASPEEIAVLPSVSTATAIVASSFDFGGERRRAVLTEAEFPTVGHVWLAHRRYGAEVDWVPLRDGGVRIEDYEPLLDRTTLIVCATHAYYQNGYLQDVGRIAAMARDAGALSYVDAYQTVGIRPVDVKALGVDFLACGAHKFLLGVPGIAFLYAREELIERLEPALTGWFGRVDPLAFDIKRLDWSKTAERLEIATPPVLNAYVATAGVSMINEIGIDAIREWTDVLSRRLIDGGLARGLTVHGTTDIARKTPTTAFVCDGDSADVEARLRERGIVAAARGPAIRLAPHFFSTIEEVDASLDALAEILTA